MNQDEIMRLAQMWGRTPFFLDNLKKRMEIYSQTKEEMEYINQTGNKIPLSEYLSKYWVDDYPLIYNVAPYFQRMMPVPKLNINRFAHQITLIARKEKLSYKKRVNESKKRKIK